MYLQQCLPVIPLLSGFKQHLIQQIVLSVTRAGTTLGSPVWEFVKFMLKKMIIRTRIREPLMKFST